MGVHGNNGTNSFLFERIFRRSCHKSHRHGITTAFMECVCNSKRAGPTHEKPFFNGLFVPALHKEIIEGGRG